MLKQEQEGYELLSEKQMSECDERLQQYLRRGRTGGREPNYPKRIGRNGSGRTRRISRDSIYARSYFATDPGTDLTQIDGIDVRLQRP